MKKNVITPPGKNHTINVEIVSFVVRAFAVVLLSILIATLASRNVSGSLGQDSSAKTQVHTESFTYSHEESVVVSKND